MQMHVAWRAATKTCMCVCPIRAIVADDVDIVVAESIISLSLRRFCFKQY